MLRDRWQFLKIFKCYTLLGLASQTFTYLLPIPRFSEVNSIWKVVSASISLWNCLLILCSPGSQRPSFWFRSQVDKPGD